MTCTSSPWLDLVVQGARLCRSSLQGHKNTEDGIVPETNVMWLRLLFSAASLAFWHANRTLATQILPLAPSAAWSRRSCRSEQRSRLGKAALTYESQRWHLWENPLSGYVDARLAASAALSTCPKHVQTAGQHSLCGMTVDGQDGDIQGVLDHPCSFDRLVLPP